METTKMLFATLALLASAIPALAEQTPVQVSTAAAVQITTDTEQDVTAVRITDGWRRLTPDELNKMLPGKTIITVNDRGNSYTIKFAPDGSIKSKSTGGGDLTSGMVYDSGKWWIEDEMKLCLQWDRWLDHKKKCSQIEKKSDESQYRYANSKKEFHFE